MSVTYPVGLWIHDNTRSTEPRGYPPLLLTEAGNFAVHVGLLKAHPTLKSVFAYRRDFICTICHNLVPYKDFPVRQLTSHPRDSPFGVWKERTECNHREAQTNELGKLNTITTTQTSAYSNPWGAAPTGSISQMRVNNATGGSWKSVPRAGRAKYPFWRTWGEHPLKPTTIGDLKFPLCQHFNSFCPKLYSLLSTAYPFLSVHECVIYTSRK